MHWEHAVLMNLFMGFVDKKKYKVTPGWTSFITTCQRTTKKNLMRSCMTNTQTSVVWNEMCRCRTPAAARWTRVIIGRVQQCSMASCQTAEVEARSGSSCMFVPLLPHSWVTYKKVSVSLNGSPVGIGVFECLSGYQLILRFCCVCVCVWVRSHRCYCCCCCYCCCYCCFSCSPQPAQSLCITPPHINQKERNLALCSQTHKYWDIKPCVPTLWLQTSRGVFT